MTSRDGDVLYREVIDCMTSGVIAYRAVRDASTGEIVDFRYVLSNAYAEKVCGKPESYLVGRRLLEEMPEHKPTGLFARYVHVVETGRPAEFVIDYHDGAVNGVFSVRAVKMGDGLVVAFTDVTEEHKRRQAFDAVADRLAVVTNAAGIGVWERDLETGEAMWDDATRRMLGLAPDEPPLHETWRARVHPEDAARVESVIGAARESGGVGPASSFRVRFRVRRPDGEVRHIGTWGRLVVAEGRRRLVGANVDVTEATERRTAFETMANRLAVATDAAGIGVWERDLETDEAMWDEATRRIFGFTADEPATPTGWRARVVPEDLPGVEAVLQAARESDGASPSASFRMRFRIVRPDGALRHIEASGKLIKSETGRRLIGVNQDVTEETERQVAFETLADRLSVAASAAGIGVWERDFETDAPRWDETSLRMFGFDSEASPTKEELRARIHREDFPRVQKIMRAVRDSRGVGPAASFRARFRIIRPDGAVRHIETWGRLVVANGRGRFVGANMDVTEETERRIAFETLANRFALATAAADIGVLEYDIETDEVIWDAACRRIHGVSDEDVDVAILWRSMVPPEDLAHVDAVIGRALQADPSSPDASFGLRYRIVRPDGITRHIQSHSRVVASDRGRRLVGVMWDVTEEVEAARELERKKVEAEAANITKSQFLAVMSHEIRTPLNGVMTMASMLEQTASSDMQRKMIRIIRDSGQDLLDMLSAILDLSRIEAGRMEIDLAEYDLDALISRAAGLFARVAEDKGLAFRVDVSERAYGALIGDQMRIRQVLNNLLSNAMKFTPEGEVALSVDLEPVAGHNGLDRDLVLTVRDTGVGVPADKLRQIFEPFTQADSSNTRRFSGAGLGLSIALRLAQIHGGSIEVQSEPNKGSTFTARFRVSVPTQSAAAAR